MGPISNSHQDTAIISQVRACLLENQNLSKKVEDGFRQTLPYIVAVYGQAAENRLLIADAFSTIESMDKAVLTPFCNFYICFPATEHWDHKEIRIEFIGKYTQIDKNQVLSRLFHACNPAREAAARGEDRLFLATYYKQNDESDYAKYWLAKSLEDRFSDAYVVKALEVISEEATIENYTSALDLLQKAIEHAPSQQKGKFENIFREFSRAVAGTVQLI